MTHEDTFRCPSCGQVRPWAWRALGALLPISIVEMVRHRHPAWTADESLCRMCVNEAKADHMERLLSASGQPPTAEMLTVLEHVRQETFITDATREAFDDPADLPGRLPRQAIAFIGHWRFSLLVLFLLLIWIGLNVWFRPFEPYPVIVLAVVSAALASLAALQAPIILMAQRELGQRDRLRSKNDYLINLKAELEIRYLNEKIDHLFEELIEMKSANGEQ